MKLRKILATTLAIAMAVLAIPAVPAQADVIDGQAAYLNTEVYDITLPTTSTQKFYLDPQGLSDIVLGGTNAGKIIGTTTMSAINNSSKPINFEVKANLVASSPAAITVVTTGALTAYDNVASSPAIKLEITASDGQLQGASPVTKSGIDGANALKDAAETIGVAASGAGITSAKYGMSPARYQVATNTAIDADDLDEVFDGSNYVYNKVSTGSSIDFVLGGECTQKTDWSAYSKGDLTLELNITFKVTKEDDSDVSLEGFAATSYTYDKSNAADVACDITLPNGLSVTATALVINLKDNLEYSATASDMLTVGTEGYTYSNGTLTLKNSAWKGYPNGTYGMGIMFNNDTNYIYWTHVTIQD